jgi:hypothetical protein
MKYIYFVSYAHERGFGNCDIINDKTIDSWEDIQRIKEQLETECNISKPVIISFQLLKREKSK